MEKVGCTRQYESELSLRSFAQPFPSGYRGCTNRPTRCFFSKTYPSFLTLKEGSTSLSKPLPSQKGKDVPTALSIVFTTPSVPLVGDRNVALNHFILWLADHQRSTPAAELRFFVRGWTRLAEFTACSMLKGYLLAAYSLLSLLLARSFLLTEFIACWEAADTLLKGWL